jgi:hypothetical protein
MPRHETRPKSRGICDTSSIFFHCCHNLQSERLARPAVNFEQASCGLSVPEHSLHFGPGTSVTSPLRRQGLKLGFWGWSLSLILNTYLVVEAGNPEGISKVCGKCGKTALWLSILWHFHGLLLVLKDIALASGSSATFRHKLQQV